ncbi:cell division protein FtsZ [Erythrobacter sp.]|jgi:cell division protein FtsZ|uniref:cell division protein FtsZ n=1 Tax=Erythrobacter sp. TaxID=1042 RepID=UPI002ECBCB4B|nr:cell division protein FtsZ [Erythrobacter sp.]
MSINIGPAASDELRPRITVIGIGGAGGNAIANMIDSEIDGVSFIVANTDAQALSQSPAENRIQLGPDITGGLGAGARPEVGKAAAEETVEQIEEALEGVNMVFIAAGMGGGTGTGAAPVIAEAARRKGVLTVGVVTKPFLFEGTRRMRAAEAGIAELQSHVDTLIVIPNQNLFLVAKPETTFKEAFQLADEVLQQGVRSITDLIVNPGLINLDFADIRAVMSEMGKAMMGTGEGEGENRALDAAEQAIANPLLDGVSMQGAKGVIISIIGGEDMTLMELDEAANYIRDLVDEDANIIWGSAFNPDLDSKIRISVVATGIEQSATGDMPQQRSAMLPTSRMPKRPVLELSENAESGEGATDKEGAATASASESPSAAPRIPTIPASPPEMSDEPAASEDDSAVDDDPAALEPTGSERKSAREAEPFDLSGMQAGDDMGDEEDDVDGIVDPLAGLRGAEEDEDDLPPPRSESGHSAPGEQRSAEDADRETLDLDNEYTGSAETNGDADSADEEQDDLLADADRLAAQDRPVEAQSGGRRRGILGSSGDTDADDIGGSDTGKGQGSGAAASGGGATLFERMANLSRSSGSSEDDEEDDDDGDDAPALSIPRFLGRQNNQ